MICRVGLPASILHPGANYYEERYQISKKAAALGYILKENPNPK